MSTPSLSPVRASPTEDNQRTPEVALAFLYASITDAQAAIRAVDTKLSIILVLLSIALTKGDLLHTAFLQPLKTHWLFALPVVLFVILWIAAIWNTFTGLAAIDNPANHVSNTGAKGTFYLGGAFAPGIVDAFFNRRSRELPELKAHIDALPGNAEQAIRELAFEQMKLVYIRSIKIKRCNIAYRSTALALAVLAVASAFWHLHK